MRKYERTDGSNACRIAFESLDKIEKRAICCSFILAAVKK